GSDDNRHRPVVHELDLHPRAEYSAANGNAERGELGAEMLIHRLRLLGRGGIAEARAVALLRVGDEGELRYDERRAAGVEQAAIEAAFVVREDAQARDLARETFCVGGFVAARNAEQHAHAGADLGDGPAVA